MPDITDEMIEAGVAASHRAGVLEYGDFLPEQLVEHVSAIYRAMKAKEPLFSASFERLLIDHGRKLADENRQRAIPVSPA